MRGIVISTVWTDSPYCGDYLLIYYILYGEGLIIEKRLLDRGNYLVKYYANDYNNVVAMRVPLE